MTQRLKPVSSLLIKSNFIVRWGRSMQLVSTDAGGIRSASLRGTADAPDGGGNT